MRVITVSSRGQIVLPADLRRRLSLNAGAKLEIIETEGALMLRPIPGAEPATVGIVGMTKATSRGRPRSLDDFDAASLLDRKARD